MTENLSAATQERLVAQRSRGFEFRFIDAGQRVTVPDGAPAEAPARMCLILEGGARVATYTAVTDEAAALLALEHLEKAAGPRS